MERLSRRHRTDMISSYGTNTDSVSRNVDVNCRTLDVTGGTKTVHQRNYIRLPRPVRPELERIKSVIQIRGRRNESQQDQEEMGTFESIRCRACHCSI
jgi:hypothetical protein